MNFICGDKFVAMSDFIYNIPHPDNYYNYPNTFSKKSIENFNGSPIIYALTGIAESLLSELANVNENVVIITHSADVPITQELCNKCPPNVIKWFSQNVSCNNPILHALPIGIENKHWFHMHNVHKEEQLERKRKEKKRYINLLYLNCSIQTNKIERSACYQALIRNSWVTSVLHPNIFNFEEYIDNIHGHTFVACPSGNGIDTHRAWETLYLGCIPIERKNFNNKFWNDLPFCFINEWTDVTQKFLTSENERIINTKWNLDKLEFPYWESLIKSYTL